MKYEENLFFFAHKEIKESIVRRADTKLLLSSLTSVRNARMCKHGSKCFKGLQCSSRRWNILVGKVVNEFAVNKMAFDRMKFFI